MSPRFLFTVTAGILLFCLSTDAFTLPAARGITSFRPSIDSSRLLKPLQALKVTYYPLMASHIYSISYLCDFDQNVENSFTYGIWPLGDPVKNKELFKQTILDELSNGKSLSLSGARVFNGAVHAASLAAAGYYTAKLFPFILRRTFIIGTNIAADYASPFVPLFVRRDPALLARERRPRFYDKYISEKLEIKPFGSSRGAIGVRDSLDYVIENREALGQLSVLSYSVAKYISASRRQLIVSVIGNNEKEVD